tara:strand:+ start:1341 stop:1808 length:468 start_codon:yes stop_codon:yes gene_type:complete
MEIAEQMINGVQIIQPIKSAIPTERDIILAAMVSMGGCTVGSMPSNPDGDKKWSDNWEWFDPFKVEDEDALPEYWYNILTRQNKSCWECNYRYVHSPTEILVDYPRTPVKGVFGVCSAKVTPDNVVAVDLIHTAGQFTEYDTRDKGIWREWLELE